MGRTAEAVQEYRRLASLLQSELGISPSTETVSVYEILKNKSNPGTLNSDGEIGQRPSTCSLAILPTGVLGESRHGKEIAGGLEQEIVSTLAKVSDLDLIVTSGGSGSAKTCDPDHYSSSGAGAKNLLKCSLQVVGDKLRLTAQLIDSETGRQSWADRYDRRVTDVLAVQEELTKEIVTQLQIQLSEGLQARVWSTGTSSFDAWVAVVRATHLIHSHRREGIREARKLAERARELDPGYAAACATIGWTHWVEARWWWAPDPQEAFETAGEYARQALALDEFSPDAHALHGVVLVHLASFDEAIREMESAVRLAPSHAHISALAAYVHRYTGDAARAVDLLDRAIKLSPGYPPWYLNTKAVAMRIIGEIAEAEHLLREAQRRDPNFPMPIALLASLLGQENRLDEARAEIRKLLRLEPEFSTARWGAQSPYREREIREYEEKGLLLAGAPE
jgi:adenylate cyclase